MNVFNICRSTFSRVPVLALPAVLLTALADAPHAHAQTIDCTTVPNGVLGIGAGAAVPFIKAIAMELAAAGDDITPIFSDPGSCPSFNALLSSTPLDKTGRYWDASGKEYTCNYPSGGTRTVDWATSPQAVDTCQGLTVPPTIGVHYGPNGGFSMIVPTSSTAQAITADALYYIFGFGPGSGHDVEPWTNPATIGKRSNAVAMGMVLARASGIPESRPFYGTDVMSFQGAINFVSETPAAVAAPDAALSICSLEFVEAGSNRQKVRSLAFQAKGQKVAYLPDSSETATDKKNLREGRYFLWGPHSFLGRIDPVTKAFTDPKVARLIGYFTGEIPLPGKKPYLDVAIESGVIPQCAMHVTRKSDLGPLEPFEHSTPCDCYFDSKRGGSNACTTCTANTDCAGAAPVCRHGFCEVR